VFVAVVAASCCAHKVYTELDFSAVPTEVNLSFVFHGGIPEYVGCEFSLNSSLMQSVGSSAEHCVQNAMQDKHIQCCS
jgi:hypothetical protein